MKYLLRTDLGIPSALVREELGQGVFGEESGVGAGAGTGPAVAQHQGDELRQRRRRLVVPLGRLRLFFEQKPVEAVFGERQQVGEVADRRKPGTSGKFERHAAPERRQIQFHCLGRAREVDDAQDRLAVVGAQIGEDLAVARIQELDGAAPEGAVALAHGDHPARPVQQRRRIALLRLDVDRFVSVDRVHDGGQEQAFGVGPGKAAVAVVAPLHGGADPVAVAEEDVVAHADLIAVVEDRSPGHGEQQAVHQFDLAAVVVHQGRQAPADAEVDAHAPVGGIEVPQVVPLLVGDHFERQFIVVAEEDRPLAAVGDIGSLPQNIGDRVAVLLGDRHVHARHQRKVERHVALVAIAEVLLCVLGPLVGLG